MYITAPPVNFSMLCIATIVHLVAFVNLLLKKMVVVVVVVDRSRLTNLDRSRFEKERNNK